jgi:protein-disulfide isomerase
MAGVWSQLEGTPLPAGRGVSLPEIPEPTLAGIRASVDLMVGSYLTRRGKSRYCDKSLGAAEHADLLMRVFPEAMFVCLYRHPMDVIASGIEASPWGLNGFGFDAYAAASPGNAVLALARFWADNAAAILAVEQRLGDRCHRVRYEDLVADPEAVAGGVFRFLGVPAAPGISQRCFTAERERLGPSDYKIWHTSRISAGSVGRGWSIPASLIGPAVTAAVNDLAGKLGYAQVGTDWGIAPVAPDLRQPGSGPGEASVWPVPGAEIWPGQLLMAARLEAGVALADDRFTRQWAPCSREAFLVTVTLASGGVAARWQVDLAARTVAEVSGIPAGSRWDIIGSADTWEQITGGGTNLSVAFRRRQLRYSDTGDAGPDAPGIRMGMIADLLGITAWQPGTASPVNPADPTGPASPVNPADPASSASPVNPADPASSASLAAPASSASPVNPADPASSASLAAPASSASPVNPADPASSASLAAPIRWTARMSARERIRMERARRARRQRRVRVAAVCAGVVVLIAAAVAVGIVVRHNRDTTVKASSGYAGPYAPVTLNADNSVMMAQPGVTKPVLDVYEDFQCSLCAAFEKANGGMIQRLADQGKVKVVYHPFTISGGQPQGASSIRAWAAAKCVPARLWVRYHNALYASQPAETNAGGFPVSLLVRLGKNAGITSPGFAQCVRSQQYAAQDPPLSDQIINGGMSSAPILKLNGQVLNVDLTSSGLRQQILPAS